ncbi:NAD binding Rossmann fold oxidoreductase [Microdochium trichocladiopsis]|uniref:NAD binding Rossmann fold oxidoreductase n=1 Tax=Microdochium trichocladiopsis TaxID=1682393 RepID=A0A9P9BSG6_9PEZI|nr:NAD binding Rossmann fold oxidoreductase [Microdochium trichocladiopsis]KAH7034770.1 NAD binding Rossmann fold oxidoreductase [Microdochium trichocladiopsis]
MADPSSAPRVINIGLIGCGEVAQVIHIPTLLYMRSHFRITYLCDVSPAALEHYAASIPTTTKSQSPVKTTRDPAELCASPEVDAVLVASSDEYHADHAIAALRQGKHVLVEKPLALCRRDVEAIIRAEEEEIARGGGKGRVMVGYMRRYAAVFEDAVREIGGLDRILYARVRDIIGPNSTFVAQSATFPRKFTDLSAGDVADKNARALEQVRTALEAECGVAVTDESTRMWRVLGGLGSHDLSLMREALGMPERVIGAALGLPVWNVLFKHASGYTISYESGLINVPQFDAHLEVYSADKIVRVQYDTPYVKALPVTLHITENGGDGVLRQTSIRKTYEDPYTLELREFWQFVVEGKEVKTTARDALQDLQLFGMIMQYGNGGR